MSFGLSDRGEELHYDGGFVGKSFDVTIYLDDTDQLTDSSTLSDVTTEPGITRETITIQSSDIQQFSGDFGFEKSVTIDTEGITGDVDGVLLIDSSTQDIVARVSIDDPEPGPLQSLDGVKSFEATPQLSTD